MVRYNHQGRNPPEKGKRKMKKHILYIGRSLVNAFNASKNSQKEIRQEFLENSIQWFDLVIEENEKLGFAPKEDLDEIYLQLFNVTFKNDLPDREERINRLVKTLIDLSHSVHKEI